MKTSTKWIIGIVVAVFVVLCLAAAGGLFAFRLFNPSTWTLGYRSGQLWSNNRGMMPFGIMPFGGMPGRQMPMNPYRGFFGAWSGAFAPLRLLVLPCICLILVILIILAVVALVRNQNQAKKVTEVVTPAPAATVVETPTTTETVVETAIPPVVVEKAVCPNCGQPVELSWNHCPNCGAPLSS